MTAVRPETRPEIVVDLAAIEHNVTELRRVMGPDVDVMVVVKADGYGHGAVETARAARRAGAAWIGTATADEALALRESGDDGPLLCWLHPPGDDPVLRAVVERGVDVTAYGVDELAEIDRATPPGSTARVQLKVDTGLSRGGVPEPEWVATFAAARRLEEDGRIAVTGIWSHFACSDEPDHPANDAQQAAYLDALERAERAGLRPGSRHLANSAAALLRPSARFDLVRCGLAAYGLDPAPGQQHEADLRPAMTVTAPLAMVKEVPAGAAVSYGHTWQTDRDTVLGLVPVGYGDGIPRHASNRAEVLVDQHRHPIRGRICMDQLVIELGPTTAGRGDRVVVFGAGAHGEPTAQEWAEACDTISYEIITRLGGRFVRRHEGASERRT